MSAGGPEKPGDLGPLERRGFALGTGQLRGYAPVTIPSGMFWARIFNPVKKNLKELSRYIHYLN